MKKLLVMSAVVLAVAVGLFWLKSRNTARDPMPAPTISRTNTQLRSSHPVEPDSAQERFAAEVLPTADDFFRRIESANVLLPFPRPFAPNDVTKFKFLGGASNTVCTFVIGGHIAVGYHHVKRAGREMQGIHSFNLAGKDENGQPLNLDQLKADPAGNERFIKTLADTSMYPPRSLEQTAIVAQQVLAALLRQDVSFYSLAESWQEQVGTNALPYFAFVFPKKAAPTTDPANVMRDEVVLILKSTSGGLVLDYFSDTSIAFAGEKSKFR